ncbi:hypothetical protein Pan54_19550 [Rubinisphaera italica]|uniref:Uncharacterized protein n=2 Tax=Rubinisphaera italica TaxID=2527969 RepID=A0A5C5XDX9_9PLAN|nr:hypothetical protein Pan54_19550 [Rubinisphaera italica]
MLIRGGGVEYMRYSVQKMSSVMTIMLASAISPALGQMQPEPSYPCPPVHPLFQNPGQYSPGQYPDFIPPGQFGGPYPQYWPQYPATTTQKSMDDKSSESTGDDDNTQSNQDRDSANTQNNTNQNNAQNFNQNTNQQASYSAGGQSSARPNMIGDYREAPFFYTNGFNNVTLPQQGIVRLDFSQNTNPIPTDRVYMNYHHYRNAFSAQAGVVGNDLLFFGTIDGPGAGQVADSILIDTITVDDFIALDIAGGGTDPALSQSLTALFGFDIFDPFAFLDSDSLVADGFDSANLDIFYLGYEKTFANERASFEVRIPILSAPNQDLDARVDNLQSLNGYQTQMGNASLLLKSLIMKDYTETFVMSGGLGLTIPTGPDFRIRDSDVLIPDQNNVADPIALANLGITPPNYIVAPSDYLVPGGPTGRLIRLPGNDITVRNDSVLFTPFLAFSQQMNRRLFTQLYFQLDLVASENTLTQPSGTTAKIKQQDTAKVDFQMMYWFFRKPDLVNPQSMYVNGVQHRQVEGTRFKGLAGIFELHGTTALIDPDNAGNPDLLSDPNFLAGNYDINNLEGVNANGDVVDLKTDRFFASSNNNRRLRSLNVTSGLQADWGDGGTMTVAAAVPLVQQASGVRLFDAELIFQYNAYLYPNRQSTQSNVIYAPPTGNSGTSLRAMSQMPSN